MGREHIVQQETLVARLEREGHDATKARELLRTFLELQVQHGAHPARLREALSEMEIGSVREPGGGHLTGPSLCSWAPCPPE
jgi:hypothetical protein